MAITICVARRQIPRHGNSMTCTIPIRKTLQTFADAVTEKMNQLRPGKPEEPVGAPFENLMTGVAEAFGWLHGQDGAAGPARTARFRHPLQSGTYSVC